jgi:hypothetical protein
LALCLTFSVLFLSTVADPIKVYAGGDFSGRVDSFNVGKNVVFPTSTPISGSATGTIRQGTTTQSVSMFITERSNDRYVCTLDLDYAVGVALSGQFDLNDTYTCSVYMPDAGLNYSISTRDGAEVSNYVAQTTFQYFVSVGGKEYTFPAGTDLKFVVSELSGYASVFVGCRVTYVCTINSTIDFEPVLTTSWSGSYINFYAQDLGKSSSIGDVVGAVNGVTDSQNQGNQIAQEGNQIAQEGNQIAQDTANTTHSIFDKISDFFSGFFDGIINALKSLFIPDDDFFSDFFTRLNNFFSEKLGALYTPIDLFIRLLQAIQNASSGNAGIPFPGLKWQDTYLIEPQTVNLQTIADDFDGLQDKIYFVTDVIMVGAVIWLLQTKLREVLKG